MPSSVKNLLCSWSGITRSRYELQINTICNDIDDMEKEELEYAALFFFFLTAGAHHKALQFIGRKKQFCLALFLYFLYGGGQKTYATKYFYLLMCKEILTHLVTENQKRTIDNQTRPIHIQAMASAQYQYPISNSKNIKITSFDQNKANE